MNQLNEKIELILSQNGPLTGKALSDSLKADPLELWRTCKKNKNLYIKSAARRYLRLDKRVRGYARLSPSIKREFFTYTLIGLKKDRGLAFKKSSELKENIKRISKSKLELTKEIIGSIIRDSQKKAEIRKDFIFLIAGDIVFNMAHSELRPEKSTGELVYGSDLDIIIIYKKSAKIDTVDWLDNQIYKKKSELLRMPGRAEEIDYILKDMSKVNAQLKFDSFEHKVACKLLDEGNFLYGNRKMFIEIKNSLKKKGLPDKLKKLQNIAVENRIKTEKKLLKRSSPLSEEEYLKLFYTTEEGEEIF